MWGGWVVLVLWATAGPQPGQPVSASGGVGGADVPAAAEAACAVEAPWAQMTVTDLPHGVVLTYATQANLVGAVQRLVRDFADRQNGGSPAGRRFGEPQLHGGAPGAPPGTEVLVPGAHATVTNTATGARLTLAPLAGPMRQLLRAASLQQGGSRSLVPCPPDLRLTPAPPGPPDVPQPR